MIAGEETFAVNLFKMASAQNAVTGLTGYKPLNAEALINANPDYVVFGGGGPPWPFRFGNQSGGVENTRNGTNYGRSKNFSLSPWTWS